MMLGLIVLAVVNLGLLVVLHVTRRAIREWRAYALADDQTDFFAFLREHRPTLGYQERYVDRHTRAHDLRIQYAGIDVADEEPLVAWRKFHAMYTAKEAMDEALRLAAASTRLHG